MNNVLKTSIIALIIAVCLIVFLFKSRTGKLVGNFELDYIDIEDNMAIYYNDPTWGGIGVIDATVFAVGYNDKFIIAKQHPYSDFRIEKSTTNYFIISIIALKSSLDESLQYKTLGPLTESDFLEERKQLGVPKSLDFTVNFKDLE